MSGPTKIEWTRRCTDCREDLPAKAFCRDKTRAHGLSFVCRKCRNAKARAAYTKKGPAGRRGFLAPTRDGDKRQARRRINYLVEQGLIPHPDDLPCMDCADELFTGHYRHEYDHARGYEGENQLYVEPVCSKCHHNREEGRRGIAA